MKPKYERHTYHDLSLNLHTERDSLYYRVKLAAIRLFIDKNPFAFQQNGTSVVKSRLIHNLNLMKIKEQDQTDWILNVNGEQLWRTMKLNGSRLLIGPNVEFHAPWVRQKIEDVSDVTILIPSIWVEPVIRSRIPWFKGEIRVLDSDIDLNYWRPSDSKRSHLLVYLKSNQDEADYLTIVDYCKELQVETSTVRYGQYSKKEFRKKLDNSFAAVWLGGTESQGLSLLEAWAMGVPTLVRSAPKYFDDVTKQSFNSSSAPLLSAKCGIEFSMESFSMSKLKLFIDESNHLMPREFVVANYSEEKSRLKIQQLLQASNPRI